MRTKNAVPLISYVHTDTTCRTCVRYVQPCACCISLLCPNVEPVPNVTRLDTTLYAVRVAGPLRPELDSSMPLSHATVNLVLYLSPLRFHNYRPHVFKFRLSLQHYLSHRLGLVFSSPSFVSVTIRHYSTRIHHLCLKLTCTARSSILTYNVYKVT